MSTFSPTTTANTVLLSNKGKGASSVQKFSDFRSCRVRNHPRPKENSAEKFTSAKIALGKTGAGVEDYSNLVIEVIGNVM